MKNKFYLTLALSFLFISMPAYAAKAVKVSALTEFNSLKPAETMQVITLERAEFKNGIVFEDGTVITGNIIDVKQPKRAKLNASFKFQPTSYTYNGKTEKITDPEFIAKYAEYKELDKAALATSAATTAGGMLFHIPLLSEGVSFAKGVWKNPKNNRFKSGFYQMYKDSPLSYVEEGKDIYITKDTMFVLKFKSSKEEDLDAESADNNEETTEDSNQTNNENSEQKEIVPVHNQNENTPSVEQTLPQKPKSIQIEDPEEVLKEVEQNSVKEQF